MLLGRLFRSKWSELLYTYTLTTKTAMQCRSLQLLTNNNGQDVKPLASFSLFFLLSCNCKTVMLLRRVLLVHNQKLLSFLMKYLPRCLLGKKTPYQLTILPVSYYFFFFVGTITAVVVSAEERGICKQIHPGVFLFYIGNVCVDPRDFYMVKKDKFNMATTWI